MIKITAATLASRPIARAVHVDPVEVAVQPSVV
jgi:hypothetical protein